MNFRTLKKEASDSVKLRGHKLGAWGNGLNRRSANCIRCGMGVSVTIKPAPNDIDIGGAAVALNCLGGSL